MMSLLLTAAKTLMTSSRRRAVSVKRPERLSELRGQPRLVDMAEILISGAKELGSPLGHTLLKGPPGTGKTTIANVLANEMSGNLINKGIGAFKKPEDVRKALAEIEDGNILFIDEIHQLPKPVQEQFFYAMEDNKIILQGKKGSVELKLPRWTLLAATTRADKLDPAFVRRFGNKFDLNLMTPEDLGDIGGGMADSIGVKYDPEAMGMLAKMAGGTPGLMKNMLMRARDTMSHMKTDEITPAVVREFQKRFGYDHLGLGTQEREMLETLEDEQTVSLSGLSQALGMDENMIKLNIEPLLFRYGLIKRSGKGRSITQRGSDHLAKYRKDMAVAA